MRPFSHGVYHNTAGVPLAATTTTLTHRSIVDITFWRALLFSTCASTAWLEVPIRIPPLIKRSPDVTAADFAHYQASGAHCVIETDAATNELDSPTWGGGWTAKRGVPHHDPSLRAWGEYQLTTFAAFLRSGVVSVTVPAWGNSHSGAHPRAAERRPRYDLPTVSGAGWIVHQGTVVPPDAPPELAALVAEFDDVVRPAIRSSLANSSRSTYQTGQRALIAFTAAYNIPQDRHPRPFICND